MIGPGPSRCAQAGIWSYTQIRTLWAVRAVPDILSQGGGRQYGPWPRRAAAAVVLVLVAVTIVHYLPRSRHGTARPAVTATPLPLPLAVSGDAGVAAEPDGITGQTLSWPDGLRLPAAGERPAWFWPATGQVLPIGGLPPQRAGYQFIRAAGGWAVQADPGGQAACGDCAGPRRAVYFLAGLAQSVTRVGLADAVAPGAAGALWLTSYPPDAEPRTAAGLAQEVSITGRPIGPRLRLPAGYLIEQGTDRGLLLAPVAQDSGTMPDTLWDPAPPQPSRAFAGVIAASATEIAWAPPCVARCRVQVLNLVTGRQVPVELPEASSIANAAFSPDGSSLAVQLNFSDDADDGATAVQLELASMASGRLTVVPETWVSSDALVGFGWAASGDSLVAELSFTTKVQLASWHPGASRLAIAVLTPQHNPASLVIGQYGPSLSPLPRLVVTGGLPGNHVQAVVGVDEGDERDQRRELVIVVLLGRICPGLVGDTTGGIGDAGALLGEFQSGALGLGEDGRLPPHRDQVEPHRAFPSVLGVLGVHVGAGGAPVDLAGPDLHQFLRRGRQVRIRHDRAC